MRRHHMLVLVDRTLNTSLPRLNPFKSCNRPVQEPLDIPAWFVSCVLRCHVRTSGLMDLDIMLRACCDRSIHHGHGRESAFLRRVGLPDNMVPGVKSTSSCKAYLFRLLIVSQLEISTCGSPAFDAAKLNPPAIGVFACLQGFGCRHQHPLVLKETEFTFILILREAKRKLQYIIAHHYA